MTLVPMKQYSILMGQVMVQANSDMTDSVGPGKLVRHMQSPSYAYDRLSPSYASVYVIALGTSFYSYQSQNSERICLAGLLLYMYLSDEKRLPVRTECCQAEHNSAHLLVSSGISRLLDMCLSGIHIANYIVNSIECAVILVRVSWAAYGIRPTHSPIHVLDMHGSRLFVIAKSTVVRRNRVNLYFILLLPYRFCCEWSYLVSWTIPNKW